MKLYVAPFAFDQSLIFDPLLFIIIKKFDFFFVRFEFLPKAQHLLEK